MVNIAVICELNPMHRGHQYLFSRIREQHPDSRIICLMSGNFVQRGDVAIASKYLRAEIAVSCGADLVLELPLPYSMMQADGFATGAIEILNRIGKIDYLYFGSECGDTNLLFELARSLASPGRMDRVIEVMKTDRRLTYPAAIQRVIGGEKGILKGANDVLAVEYLKAILKSGSSIVPVAVRRIGGLHDSNLITGGIPSASYIRKLLMRSPLDSTKELLESSEYNILEKAKDKKEMPVQLKHGQAAIMAHLREGRFANIDSGERAFGQFVSKCAKKSRNIDELFFCLKSKHYTLAGIRRKVLNLYLDIPTKAFAQKPEYTCVLALDSKGRDFLKEIKKESEIRIITKPAYLKQLERDCDQIRINLNADRKYTLFYPEPKPEDSMFQIGPYYREEV